MDNFKGKVDKSSYIEIKNSSNAIMKGSKKANCKEVLATHISTKDQHSEYTKNTTELINKMRKKQDKAEQRQIDRQIDR